MMQWIYILVVGVGIMLGCRVSRWQDMKAQAASTATAISQINISADVIHVLNPSIDDIVVKGKHCKAQHSVGQITYKLLSSGELQTVNGETSETHTYHQVLQYLVAKGLGSIDPRLLGQWQEDQPEKDGSLQMLTITPTTLTTKVQCT